MCPRCAILLFDGRETKGRNDHTDIQGVKGAKTVPAAISRSHGPEYVFARTEPHYPTRFQPTAHRQIHICDTIQFPVVGLTAPYQSDKALLS
jgi:hypothetical protein